MKILHIIESMDPVSGGPCQGIRYINTETVQHGASREVVCLDSFGRVWFDWRRLSLADDFEEDAETFKIFFSWRSCWWCVAIEERHPTSPDWQRVVDPHDKVKFDENFRVMLETSSHSVAIPSSTYSPLVLQVLYIYLDNFVRFWLDRLRLCLCDNFEQEAEAFKWRTVSKLN